MVEADIFAFCLRRSGHTAIMNWVAAQLQPSHSLKDCNMTDDTLSTPVVHIIEDDELRSEFYDGTGLQYLSREQRRHLNKYKLTLCSFEDSRYINFSTESINDIVERYKLINDAKVVIVMRDPFNLFASRVWRNRDNLEVPGNLRAASWYNMQLKQWYENKDFMFIEYYRWVVDKNYRIQIAEQLEIPYSDNFYDVQANISSFDGFDYRAVKSGFNSRWRHFLLKANNEQKKEYLDLLSGIDFELVNEFFLHIDSDEIYKSIKELL